MKHRDRIRSAGVKFPKLSSELIASWRNLSLRKNWIILLGAFLKRSSGSEIFAAIIATFARLLDQA